MASLGCLPWRPPGNGDTAIKLNGEVYDAQSWMRGASLCGPARWAGTAPNTAERLTEPPLRSLALTLAQFHRSTADLRPAIEDTCSPLVQRLTDADRSLGLGAKFLTTAVEQGQYGGDRTLALRWLETLPRAIFLARAILDRHPESANAVSTVCHGDLWAAHIYADERGFSGFIDFESLTWSSPTVDVAQLLVHCGDWRQRDAVVQAYSSVLPLTTDGWNVLPAAVIADVAGEGLWAMSALATGLPSHRIAHSNNLTALFQSLSLVVEEVEAHL